MAKEIDQKTLKSLLTYSAETGLFLWAVKPSMGVRIGDVAGTNHPSGYRSIQIQGGQYLSHRLAWLYEFGVYPDCDIDHINRNKKDNRISNLRLTSRQENCQNVGMNTRNTSGVKGVCWHKKASKWQASISAVGIKVHLGVYAEFESAVRAREEAEVLMHTHRPTSEIN